MHQEDKISIEASHEHHDNTTPKMFATKDIATVNLTRKLNSRTLARPLQNLHVCKGKELPELVVMYIFIVYIVCRIDPKDSSLLDIAF